MISFGTYLLESSICLICFYSIFFFLLKNETWFQLNRWYLLGSVLFSISIPLFHYNIDIPILINVATEGNTVIANSINSTELSEVSGNIFFTFNNLLNAILGIYLLGIIIYFSIFIKGLLGLRDFYVKGRKENKDGVTYVFGENDNSVFSFFNFIFINKEIEHYTEKEQRQIINHELAHIQDKHSLDLLLLEMFKIIFWFNPIMHAYKNSMLQLHEYIADEKVLEKEENALEYASFLVNQVKENTRVYSFCNHLFHKPIKNRLIMMNKSKSKGRNAMMAFSFVPVLAGMVFYFCIEYKEIPMNIAEKDSSLVAVERDSTPTPPKVADLDFTPEPGKCYAKCMIPTTEEVVEKISLNVFTGKDASGIDTEIKEIVVKPAYEKWVKKKAGKNSDELVWALVNVPPKVEKVVVVKDITQTKAYEIKIFEIKEIVGVGEYTDWKEVVCTADITPDLIGQIQTKLKMLGYDVVVDNVFGKTTKIALSKYQKKNDLPVGNLNMATVKSLSLDL